METIWVDPALCQGHGKCYRIAPDLLRPKDDHGHAEVIVDAIAADDADKIAQANAAINRCPEEALSWKPVGYGAEGTREDGGTES